MILFKLIEYLTGELDVYVGVSAPKSTSGYVLIDQTGSNNRNHITTTTVAVQSYGASLEDAIRLNERVKSALLDIVNEDEISGVKLINDYNFTNTATKQYRWQAVFEITHYLGGI